MPIKTVNSKTLKNWLENNEAVVVDVREPTEHSSEKIEGAELLPLGSVTKTSLPSFGNKKLVIHCRSGKRSEAACQKLIAEDPNLEIYNLEGGIVAWMDCGHKTDGTKAFCLPLERQVQVVVGLLGLFGSALSYFLNPAFAIIPAFLGAGLIFAGLTGYCGLAMLLARMPWNQSYRSKKSCSA